MSHIEQVPPTAGAGQELPRELSVWGGIALAISNVGPTVSVGVGLGTLSAAVGAQMPIIFLVAFLPMLGIATSYVYLNRVEPNCGTSYVWLRKALSPWIGYLSGWIGIAGSVVYMSYGAPLAGKMTLALFNSLGMGAANPDSVVQSTLLGVAWLALTTFLAVRGTEHAIRFQLLLVGVEVLVVGTLSVLAFAKGNASHIQFAWFNPADLPTGQALAGGLVLAVYVYWGWDSAFSVTEETQTPGQASRAGLLTLLAVLVMFVISACAFQSALTPAELVKEGPLGLPYLGTQMAGDVGGLAAIIAMLFSSVAVLQSIIIATARMTLAMSRDRTLGSMWSRLHPVHGTPARGTLVLGGISIVLTLLSAMLGPLQTVITGFITAIGLLVSLTYGLAGIASAWYFRGWLKTSPGRALLAVVLPFLSALVLIALGVYLAVTQATSTDHLAFDPTNGWFLDALPAVIVLMGLGLAAWTKYYRKAPYFDRSVSLNAPTE